MLKKGNRANTLHGILLIVLFSFAAFYIAGFPLVKKLSFSPLIVGIVLGMLYANSLRNKLPETWVPGIRFCTKQVLRWGIILYGFRLTLSEVAAVGIPAVAVDLVVVTVTILARPAGTPAEDRPRHGADDLDGQCHLRRGGRIGC